MKDAYYFQHDANARHDPKLLMLAKEFGMEGLGRWWCLVEILREQEDYVFDISEKHNLKALKHELDFKTEEELIKFLDELVELCLIRRYDGKILSHALLKRMQRLDETRAKRSEAGIKSGEVRKALTEQKKLNEHSSNTVQHRSNTVQHRSNNVQHRSNTVQHTSPKREHLPTYLPTESQSDSATQQFTNPETYSLTQAPPPTKPNKGIKPYLHPNIDTVYTNVTTYGQVPSGEYYVPLGVEESERKVWIKVSDSETRIALTEQRFKISNQERLVLTRYDFSRENVSGIIQ